MKTAERESLKTKERLLSAAAEVFAEKGYRDATISEICERAGANIASVNYHFRDKETLYREAWRSAFHESLRSHPPDGGVGCDAPPEEKLKGLISALISRILDERNKEFPIVYRELVNPTGLLEEVVEAEIRPLQEKMERVLRELLGLNASQEDARFAAISVVSQCITPLLAHRFRRLRREMLPEIENVESYIQHVVRFSLGGIRRIREELERRGSHR